MAERRLLRLGVRGRLVLLATVALAVALAVAVVVLGVAVRAALLGSLDDAGRQRAQDVAALVEAGRVPDPLPVTGSAVVQVVDAGGRVLASSPGGDRLAPLVDAAALAAVRAGEGIGVDGARLGSAEPFRVVGATAGVDDGTTVLVATSAAEVDRALGVLRRVALLGVPLVLLATALLAWRVSGSALRPVEELRQGAERIAAAPARPPGPGRGGLPVPPSGDEVARLAETLNAMLSRLDEAGDRQRAFLADAAHELRNPLGSVRTQLEVAAANPSAQDWAAVCRDALTDVERMSALVADLLVLARLDSGGDAAPGREPVDLVRVAREALGSNGSGAEVALHGRSPVTVAGDARALSRVVANLLANATRHARSRVDVRVGVEGGDAVLDVVDDGPGIPPADRQRVFDRFTRLDAARARDDGGTGLGLAIVRAAVVQHGGTVEVLDGDGGVGATVRVRLPVLGVPAVAQVPVR